MSYYILGWQSLDTCSDPNPELCKKVIQDSAESHSDLIMMSYPDGSGMLEEMDMLESRLERCLADLNKVLTK